MIKRFNKILAGITAAAALLLAAGCKNQLDYLNDTTARNAFNVAGLYVSGLDAGYNGANVALKVVAVNENGDKSDVDYVTGTVADSYKNASGETVGHQSGTVYIKLDEAKLYDGDKMAVDYFNANGDADDYVAFSASSIECYLQVGSDTIKVISSDGSKLENAKLSVPTSEAGTKDADLISRWVTVNVADGVGTFALAGNATEPVNVTLPHIGLNLTTVTSASDLPAGVTINTSTDTTKATDGITNVVLTITGIPEDFKDYVMILSGADIGDSASTIETGNWHYDKTSNVFKQTVVKAEADIAAIGVKESEYYISYDFYGQRQTWRADCDIEMLISDYNGGEGNQDSNNRLLDQVTENKADTNFMLPKYLWGSKKVSITINMNDLTKGEQYAQADPEAERSIIYVDGIKIINAPSSFNNAGYLAFMSEWFDAMGINKWDATTENKITSTDYILDSDAYLVGPYEYHPNKSTFALDMQVVNPNANDFDSFWADETKVLNASTPTYQTSEFSGKHVIAVYELNSSGDFVDAYIKESSKDSKIENLLTFSKKDIITGYFVKGWYGDDWKGLDVAKITKINDHSWSWEIKTTSEIRGYKFSIIPVNDDWSDRYELANSFTLSIGTEVGPLNHNKEPTRAEINLSAGKTYTFTVTNKNKGVFVKVTSN